MNALLATFALAIGAFIIFFVPSFGAAAVVVCAVMALGAGLILSRLEPDREFLLQIFVAALLVRLLVGTAIFSFNLQEFFGGDAFTYDTLGLMQVKVWQGEMTQHIFQALMGPFLTRNWGMLYVVAGIYGLIGQNMLAVQFVNAIFGAATAPIIFLCAKQIFGNLRVARLSTFFVAFYPSLVLWSSQGLKDGLLVFLLTLAMLATLRLGERFSLKFLLVLVLSLMGILSLRFYVFYMVLAAIGGAFAIGMRQLSAKSIARQFAILVVIGLTLTYLGTLRSAGTQMEVYSSLDMLQRSRADLANSAQSGFGRDVDVSTTAGALSVIPLGLIYLLFAPFPWQLASLRQSITLPEMVLWWASFPLLIMGLWFTLRYRLRQALPILIFTAMLTLAYSMFQGNVGTAYRQRSQLLVFFFMFVSVGYVLIRERRENERELAGQQKATEVEQAEQQRRIARQIREDRQRAIEGQRRRQTLDIEREHQLEQKRIAAARWAEEANQSLRQRARGLQSRAELRRELRDCFLTHQAATEEDFERCWPELLDSVLMEHAFRVLSASPQRLSHLWLPASGEKRNGDGEADGHAAEPGQEEDVLSLARSGASSPARGE